MFWPKNEGKSSKRKPKEKIPAVATSAAWQEFHREKEIQKNRRQIEIAEKKKKRQEVAEQKKKEAEQKKKEAEEKKRRKALEKSEKAEKKTNKNLKKKLI